MAARSVLILDDDLALLRALETGLQPVFHVYTAQEREDALRILSDVSIDLGVVNYSVGKLDGRALIRDLKILAPNLPCILLMASEAQAIEAAVEGILTKPFTAEALRDCLLRILLDSESGREDLLLDPEHHSVRLDGRTVLLTPIEFRILSELWIARGRLVRREDICAKLWGTTRVTVHTFDTHFTNMKRKIPELRDRIAVVRSQGYIFTP